MSREPPGRERAPADLARANAGDRILRSREVCTRVGLSRTTLWRAVRRGDFPAPRQLTANAIGWLASEIDAWIGSRTPTRAAAPEVASPGGAS
jgi:prophage regulatory protein